MSRTNLIDNEEIPESRHPTNYQNIDIQNDFETITLPGQHDNTGTLTNSINCQVCRNFINLDQKMNNLVVKCNNCNEATPIKAAPPGKKYVRCTCNGLLICKSSSSRVGCPRPHCKSIITLAPSTDEIGVATGITSQTGLLAQSIRVTCVNCSSAFIISVQKQKKYMVAKCPHCQKNSSIGPYYARVRWITYLTLALIFIGLGIGITVGTYTKAYKYNGYYVAYVGLILCGIILLIRGAIYCCMPISTMETTLLNRV